MFNMDDKINILFDDIDAWSTKVSIGDEYKIRSLSRDVLSLNTQLNHLIKFLSMKGILDEFEGFIKSQEVASELSK